MAGDCFICEELLTVGDTVVVDHGLQTLKNASGRRGDGHIGFLNSIDSVTVHVHCRKDYTRKSSITAFKKRSDVDAAGPSPRKKRVSVFDFRTLCLFCGDQANKQAEKKKTLKYRRKIKQVTTLSFKEFIIKRGELRGDRYGQIMKERAQFGIDLVAAGAKYHDDCFKLFIKIRTGGKVGRPVNENIKLSMDEIFDYIENHEYNKFTLKELVEVIKEYVPDEKTIIKKLIDRYRKNILITRKNNKLTIITILKAVVPTAAAKK